MAARQVPPDAGALKLVPHEQEHPASEGIQASWFTRPVVVDEE
jgi:hypothetical protein